VSGILDWSHHRSGGGGGWFHSSVKTVSRSAGRSVVAAAAYRTGERLHDQETDLAHDFTRRSGVAVWFTLAPKDAPEWGTQAEQLWNQAQAADTRKNSRTARECELALPASVSAEEREAIVRAFAQEIVDRYGVAVTAAIHEPGKGSDLNHHAHLLFTTRRLGAEGFGEKTRELDDRKTGPEEIAWMRERACALINEALERNGIEERVDHRSFADRGIEREATTHLGPTAAAMERRGKESDRGDINRDRLGRDQTLDQLVAELAALDAEIAREQQERIFGFEAFEPQALPDLDPRDLDAWPDLSDAQAEEAQVEIAAAPFTADIESRGEVQEIDTGSPWWQRSAEYMAQLIDQARGFARDTWQRFVSRDDPERDIDLGPDMG
jgi:hypothetical protein